LQSLAVVDFVILLSVSRSRFLCVTLCIVTKQLKLYGRAVYTESKSSFCIFSFTIKFKRDSLHWGLRPLVSNCASIYIGMGQDRTLINLSNAVVDVNSVKVFKSRLDNFWKFHDVKIDYTADLTGTRDQSEFDT